MKAQSKRRFCVENEGLGLCDLSVSLDFWQIMVPVSNAIQLKKERKLWGNLIYILNLGKTLDEQGHMGKTLRVG